jgi:hypothetical protein
VFSGGFPFKSGALIRANRQTRLVRDSGQRGRAAKIRPIIAREFQMDELSLSSSNLSAPAITAIASAALLAFAGGFATAWLLEQYLKALFPRT